MLRNATRELEQRRRVPRQLFHASLTFHGTLSQRCNRQAFASQAAVATDYEDGKLPRFRQDNHFLERHSSRTLSRIPTTIGLYSHAPQSSTTDHEYYPASQFDTGTDGSVRQQQHPNASILPVDSAYGYEPDVTESSSNLPERSTTHNRRRNLERDAKMSKSWSNQSPSLLLKRVLEPNEHAEHWKMQTAQSRSLRLPVILLQMMIRKEISRAPSESPLLDVLPSPKEWDETMGILQRNGHSYKDLDHYLYILEGETDDARCARFLDSDSYKPAFILHFLLRRSSRITELGIITRLIDYCSSWCTHVVRSEVDKPSFARCTSRWAMGVADFTTVTSLLAYHCMQLDPRHVVKLGDLAVQYIEAMVNSPFPQEDVYQAQCTVFNHALGLFLSDVRTQPILRSSPNVFFWEAQRTLLAVSATLEKPLLVDMKGFRAIRSVLASLSKSQAEMHSSVRHASTWPPYLQPGDGMDEEMDHEDNWSRSVRAGMMMQEAGFAKSEYDDAVDILQGMSPDGTPTIQQRISLARHRKVGIWEASIRATRNAQEAWERFQNPPRDGLKHGLAEYAAMFEKLVRREADADAGALPGDKALNFPTQKEANLTEFERARLRPPSVSQLYKRMLLDGIRPRGNCLQILVANTESMEMARKYLHDSQTDGTLYRLMLQDMEVQALKRVPLGLVSAYIQVMTRQEGKRARRYMIRAIELAEKRLGSDQSRWSELIWGMILKNLSQHRHGLRILLSQQLKLSLHVLQKLDGPRGITLSAFIQFGKSMRKMARRQIEQLVVDMESGTLAVERHPLWLLYVERSKDKEYVRRSSSNDESEMERVFHLFGAASSRMTELFGQLRSHEKESQQLLGIDRVAPLDGMMWRRDPARSEHAYEYMVSLAYLGEFQQMAKLVGWLIEEWGRPDIVQALSELDELPPYADFLKTLCAFRLLAEPMLEQATVESLRKAIDAAGLDWTWPDEEAVEAYSHMQEDESVSTLARVLERVRLSQTKTGSEAEIELGHE